MLMRTYRDWAPVLTNQTASGTLQNCCSYVIPRVAILNRTFTPDKTPGGSSQNL